MCFRLVDVLIKGPQTLSLPAGFPDMWARPPPARCEHSNWDPTMWPKDAAMDGAEAATDRRTFQVEAVAKCAVALIERSAAARDGRMDSMV